MQGHSIHHPAHQRNRARSHTLQTQTACVLNQTPIGCTGTCVPSPCIPPHAKTHIHTPSCTAHVFGTSPVSVCLMRPVSNARIKITLVHSVLVVQHTQFGREDKGRAAVAADVPRVSFGQAACRTLWLTQMLLSSKPAADFPQSLRPMLQHFNGWLPLLPVCLTKEEPPKPVMGRRQPHTTHTHTRVHVLPHDGMQCHKRTRAHINRYKMKGGP